ncbi:hypothetical protein F8M41_001615 [Gigaspora margarita]|uniref:Uncharacterized protein n=1 Tax=Gigaspora margarita TaxID=4874 RepID=A0A8H4AZ13_GIGMA|nr:hypothetical protein F8M41_001615 [Gigaspora margarita]
MILCHLDNHVQLGYIFAAHISPLLKVEVPQDHSLCCFLSKKHFTRVEDMRAGPAALLVVALNVKTCSGPNFSFLELLNSPIIPHQRAFTFCVQFLQVFSNLIIVKLLFPR